MAAADDPEALPRHHGTIRRVWRRLGHAQAKVMAGGVAFFEVLAVVPAMFALLSLYGLVADVRDVQEHVDALAGLLPRQVRTAIQAELMQQVRESAAVLGIELAGSVLVASWSAMSATEALMAAITAVRGERETRSWLRFNLTAFLLTLGGIVFGAVALAALIAFPSLLRRLDLARGAGPIVNWLRWPLLAGALLLGLTVLYRHGSPARAAPSRWLSPGALIATIAWLPASALFSWFVARHTSYAGLDGSIAGVSVLLAWFLISAWIVIGGAAIDAETRRR